jgi:asparagine synthase (glutamine-hydrolysing)
MESQALFDLLYYLQDDLLTKVDRASMKYSIETRVPYLDHRVVELALNLAPSLKYKDGISKSILKEILYQYVPKKFFERPKQGFAIPLLVWLRNQLRYLIDDYLNQAIVEKYNVVKYEEVADLKNKFFGGVDYLYNRLWLLIVLHKWLERHGDSVQMPED